MTADLVALKEDKYCPFALPVIVPEFATRTFAAIVPLGQQTWAGSPDLTLLADKSKTNSCSYPGELGLVLQTFYKGIVPRRLEITLVLAMLCHELYIIRAKGHLLGFSIAGGLFCHLLFVDQRLTESSSFDERP